MSNKRKTTGDQGEIPDNISHKYIADVANELVTIANTSFSIVALRLQVNKSIASNDFFY